MSQSGKRILVVSLAFPPLAYPRSVQVARLLKHWGGESFVFCADEPGTRFDRTIEADPSLGLACLVPTPVRKPAWDRLIDSLSYRYIRGYWNRRNLVPDKYGRWRKDVVRTIRNRFDNIESNVNAIVTFAQPFSDHLIGLELKQRSGLPWLAHFSDPWSDNPFTPFDEHTLALNRELERRVAESADLLVFTSWETVDLFCRKYPAEIRQKARILPQCFDKKRYDTGSPNDGKPICIRYLGNFYGSRTPRPLIEALSLIHHRAPERLHGIKFELIGEGNIEEVKTLASGLPENLIAALPSVDYAESLTLMSESDGLLVIDAPADVSVFLPSKLIDYIGSGRPVFGLSPKGTAANLIHELGGFVGNPADAEVVVESLSDFIKLLVSRRNAGSRGDWGTQAVRERFAVERVAADFDKLITELKVLY